MNLEWRQLDKIQNSIDIKTTKSQKTNYKL